MEKLEGVTLLARISTFAALMLSVSVQLRLMVTASVCTVGLVGVRLKL